MPVKILVPELDTAIEHKRKLPESVPSPLYQSYNLR